MRGEAGLCSEISTTKGILIMTPLPERLPTKAKEALFPHEVRLVLLDTNPVLMS